MAVVHVPTTLLGMVDAAIGGKTGINTAEGKNLVGAFHPPSASSVTSPRSSSLPQNEYRAGLAEVVKVGFTHDPVILDLIEADPAAAAPCRRRSDRRAGGPFGRREGRRCFRRPARGGGARVPELRSHPWPCHREERALPVAAWCGGLGRAGLRCRAGSAGGPHGPRSRACGTGRFSPVSALPTRYAADMWGRLYDTMKVDKKTRGSCLRFVVLDGLGRPGRLEGPDPALLAAAYAEISGEE